MKRLLFILSILLFNSCGSNAQQQINIIIDNAPSGVFEFKQLKGTEQIKIAEAKAVKNKLTFKGDFESGLYAIFHQGKGISFIVNESKIELQTDWSLPYSNVSVLQSKENDAWLTYKNKRDVVFNKLKLLQPVTIGYDKSSNFYKEAVNEFYNVQNQLINYSKTIDASSLAYVFINADLRPQLIHNKPYEIQKKELKTKWFKSFDWNDDRLLNSDILPLKIDDFMGLYFNNKLSKEQQEEEFKNGIDILLDQAKVNSNINDFVLSYLVTKLEKFNMEKVILHIAENYINTEDSCEKESSNSEIVERLKKFEQMRVGKTASTISGLNLKNKLVNAFTNASDKNLVVFWSSQCTHCRQMMPSISNWYKKAKQNGWNLITISLDTDKTELKKAMIALKLEIPVVTDYKGWESEIALNYNVSATPAMFVLDSNRTILGKPNWLSDLKTFD